MTISLNSDVLASNNSMLSANTMPHTELDIDSADVLKSDNPMLSANMMLHAELNIDSADVLESENPMLSTNAMPHTELDIAYCYSLQKVAIGVPEDILHVAL